jgi:hypothetical protein
MARDEFRGYYRAQRDEAQRQREVNDLRRERSLREAKGETLTEEEEQLYREQLQSREFSTYQVTTLPNKKENYGRGPSKSTRVASHKFVPTNKATDQFLGREVINSGTVYVRFARPSQQQNGSAIYKYSNVPLATYESFRNNNSKGRFINNPLNSHNPEKLESGDEFDRFCSDL